MLIAGIIAILVIVTPAFIIGWLNKRKPKAE
jgi:hypothetical protein